MSSKGGRAEDEKLQSVMSFCRVDGDEGEDSGGCQAALPSDTIPLPELQEAAGNQQVRARGPSEMSKTMDVVSSSFGLNGSTVFGRASPSSSASMARDMTPVVSNMSQRSLISRVSEAECIETFIKNRPVVLFRLTVETVSKVPEVIIENLGATDKSTYPMDMLERCLGGAIVLQVSDGEPDFYPIGRAAYETYNIIHVSEVSKANQGLWEDLTAILDADLEAFPHLEAGRKAQEVHMVRLSAIGFDIEEEAQLEAPWGGSQTKPAQQDAYLALGYNEGVIKEVYMVNSDHQGRPIAYLPASDVAAHQSACSQLDKSPGRLSPSSSQKARRAPV